MPVRCAVIAQFQRVANQQGKKLALLSDDLVLLESGLDSLCFAIIVACLEDELGVDPFSAAEEMDFPITLGDFVKFYEKCLEMTRARSGIH
jgi:acyl carrier protein